jgi:site-specific DNA-methyltransferase (adenine-specific)
LRLTEYNSTDRYPRSVQFFSSDKQSGSFHPTQKPVAWMKFLVATYTRPGQVVMDNTMGSGTTGMACLQLNRRFFGIEKDEVIFATAKARLDAELIG